MRIISSMQDGELKIRLEGELDHHAARNAMTRIESLIDLELPRKTALDLAGLSFMDSSGIALIIRAYRRMDELSGSLTITNITHQAHKVLNAAGILKIVPVESKTARAHPAKVHRGARDKNNDKEVKYI